jgi:glycopeptide antibiotics resistance protein
MKKLLWRATFVIYLLGVFYYTLGWYILLIRSYFGHIKVKGIGFNPEFNMVPFTNTAPQTFMLNILLFIPFGVLLPLASKTKTLAKVTLFAFLTSLTIELFQIGIGRVTDINDLITNTLGAVIGYGLYYAYRY